MLGIRKNRLAAFLLDDAAAIHHRDAIGQMLDHAKVMADEQIAETELGLQIEQQV